MLTVKERDEEAKSNWIEVLQQIVRCPVECHSSSLGDEIVPHLIPTDEIEWEEKEHL